MECSSYNLTTDYCRICSVVNEPNPEILPLMNPPTVEIGLLLRGTLFLTCCWSHSAIEP